MSTNQFDKNEEVQSLAEALWSRFGQLSPGTVVAYADAETTMGYSRHSGRGKHILRLFRARLLRERGIVTRCVASVGVTLLTDAQAASRVPAERLKKMYRQAGKLLRETDATAAAGNLSDHQRRVLATARDNARTSRLIAGRAKREHESSLRPTQTVPLRPITR